MKNLVIGGLGYLGSIISNKLKMRGEYVDIFDNCMFDQEDILPDINHNNFIQGTTLVYPELDVSLYDKIYWCSDIDIPEYYEEDWCKDDDVFFVDCNAVKEFYYMGHFLDLVECEHNHYQDFLIERRKLVFENKQSYFRIGILYGASPRMRWDTLVNRMIFYAIVQNQIVLQSDWLRRFPICNVVDAAEYIISHEPIKDDKDVEVCSTNMSMIEIAHIIEKKFKDLEIITIDLADVHDSSLLPRVKGDFDIGKSIDWILKGLETGQLPDFEKDKYNNGITISNMFNGIKAYERLRG